MNNQRLFEPDLIRSTMIFIVFMAHAIPSVTPAGPWAAMWSALSPGMTMSLLGFLSGTLLSERSADGDFLIKRGLRIFVPLWTCMAVILVMMLLWPPEDTRPHSLTHPHTLLHLLGMSAFGQMFGVDDQSPIGSGLWFITAIFGLYLFLPVLNIVLKHRNRVWHLCAILCAAGICHTWIYESESLWNVVIGFSLGAYYQMNRNSGSRWHDPRRHWATARQKLLGLSMFIAFFILIYLLTVGYGGMNKNIRDSFFPLYPLVCIPAFSWVATWGCWTPVLQRVVSLFSMISFEFYLVHFYFINGHWGMGQSYLGILVGFVVSISIAAIMYQCNKRFSKVVESYLLGNSGKA